MIQFGIIGVAIGTVLATLFRFVYYAMFLSKHIICRSIVSWIKRMAINVITFMMLVLLGVKEEQYTIIHDYISWAIYAIVVTFVVSIFVFGINMVFYRDDLLEILNRGFGRNTKKASKRRTR